MARTAVCLASLVAIPLLIVFLSLTPYNVAATPGGRALRQADEIDVSLQFVLFGEVHINCSIGLTHHRVSVKVEYRLVYANTTLIPGPWISLGNVEETSNVNSPVYCERKEVTIPNVPRDLRSLYIQLRFVQQEHGGGICNCWGIDDTSLSLSDGTFFQVNLTESEVCDSGKTIDISNLLNTSQCLSNPSTLYYCADSALIPRGVVSGLTSLDPSVDVPTCEMLVSKVIDDKGPSPATDCSVDYPHMDINFKISFPKRSTSCNPPNVLDDGVEFAFGNWNNDGKWIPLQFYAPVRARQAADGNNFLGPLVDDQLKIRGFIVPVTVSRVFDVNLRVCDNKLIGRDNVQFRWLQSPFFRSDRNARDVWWLDNVVINVHHNESYTTVLVNDSFDQQTLNSNVWNPALINGLQSVPCDNKSSDNQALLFGTTCFTPGCGTGKFIGASRLVSTASSVPLHQFDDCGPPPDIGNGTSTTPSNTVLGATITYTCDDGYTSEGTPTVFCTASGDWSDPPLCIDNSTTIVTSAVDSTTVGPSLTIGTPVTMTASESEIMPTPSSTETTGRPDPTPHIEGLTTKVYVQTASESEITPTPTSTPVETIPSGLDIDTQNAIISGVISPTSVLAVAGILAITIGSIIIWSRKKKGKLNLIGTDQNLKTVQTSPQERSRKKKGKLNLIGTDRNLKTVQTSSQERNGTEGRKGLDKDLEMRQTTVQKEMLDQHVLIQFTDGNDELDKDFEMGQATSTKIFLEQPVLTPITQVLNKDTEVNDGLDEDLEMGQTASKKNLLDLPLFTPLLQVFNKDTEGNDGLDEDLEEGQTTSKKNLLDQLLLTPIRQVLNKDTEGNDGLDEDLEKGQTTSKKNLLDQLLLTPIRQVLKPVMVSKMTQTSFDDEEVTSSKWVDKQTADGTSSPIEKSNSNQRVLNAVIEM